MADGDWKRSFDDPIPLPRGRELVTLEDAGNYITKLPKAEQDLEEWQAAIEALIMAAEDRGPLMHARIGVMRALNRSKSAPAPLLHAGGPFLPDQRPARAKSERKIKRLRPKEWTESELDRLRVLAKSKVSARIVAELLGRHVGSVKKKAREIGLILSKDVKSSCNP